MTEKFVASNGVVVDRAETGIGTRFVVEDNEPAQGGGSKILQRRTWLDPRDALALREFFLHERDAELGRWRWADYPDYVVQEEDGLAHIYHERSGAFATWSREEAAGDLGGFGRDTARAYFAAHPAPKPWHDAHRNELWLLDIQGGSGLEPHLVVGGTGCQDGLRFRHVNHINGHECDLTSPYIRSGRRIWPEVS